MFLFYITNFKCLSVLAIFVALSCWVLIFQFLKTEVVVFDSRSSASIFVWRTKFLCSLKMVFGWSSWMVLIKYYWVSFFQHRISFLIKIFQEFPDEEVFLCPLNATVSALHKYDLFASLRAILNSSKLYLSLSVTFERIIKSIFELKPNHWLFHFDFQLGSFYWAI